MLRTSSSLRNFQGRTIEISENFSPLTHKTVKNLIFYRKKKKIDFIFWKQFIAI